jgi:hypothetical protein
MKQRHDLEIMNQNLSNELKKLRMKLAMVSQERDRLLELLNIAVSSECCGN